MLADDRTPARVSPSVGSAVMVPCGCVPQPYRVTPGPHGPSHSQLPVRGATMLDWKFYLLSDLL